MKRIVLVPLLAVMLAGCVTAGTKVDPNVVAGFKPGVTTLSDARAALGPANNTTTLPDGGTVLIYAWTHAAANGASYIPIAGPFVGKSNAQTQSATLFFDKDGKFVRETHSEGQTTAAMH